LAERAAATHVQWIVPGPKILEISVHQRVFRSSLNNGEVGPLNLVDVG
jgi:hypothetical protein